LYVLSDVMDDIHLSGCLFLCLGLDLKSRDVRLLCGIM